MTNGRAAASGGANAKERGTLDVHASVPMPLVAIAADAVDSSSQHMHRRERDGCGLLRHESSGRHTKHLAGELAGGVDDAVGGGSVPGGDPATWVLRDPTGEPGAPARICVVVCGSRLMPDSCSTASPHGVYLPSASGANPVPSPVPSTPAARLSTWPASARSTRGGWSSRATPTVARPF